MLKFRVWYISSRKERFTAQETVNRAVFASFDECHVIFDGLLMSYS